jgi:hypothetical protein
VNKTTKKFAPWTEIASTFEYDPDRDVSSPFIFAPEYTRNEFVTQQLLEGGHPIM